MIDPKERTALRKAIADLVDGRSTNEEFDDLYAERWESSADAAVATIGEFVQTLYSDLMTYRLIGCYQIDRGTRATVERCLLFLRTDLDYDWPKRPAAAALQPVAGGLAMFLILPLGIVLVVAALALQMTELLLAGLAVLGLGWLLWWWSRNDSTLGWREYWSHGERHAWPFLRQMDCEARQGP